MSFPLVLLGGTLCDVRLWQGVMDELPEEIPVSVLIPGYADNWDDEIAYLLSQLPEKCILVGFSLGGIAALAIAQRAPKQIEKLILIASTSRDDPPESQQKRQEILKQARLARNTGYLGKQLIAENERRTLLPDTLNIITRMADEMPLEQFSNQVSLACNRVDSRPWLQSTLLPIIIIYGDRDSFCPADRQHEIHLLVKNSQIFNIAEGGHWLPLSHPVELANLLIKQLDSQVSLSFL